MGSNDGATTPALKLPGTRPAGEAVDGQLQWRIVREDVLHDRYMTLYNRTVRFTSPQYPMGQLVDFDVVGHPRQHFLFTVIFPFHPYRDGRKGGEVTVIREYGQGPDSMVYCLPTGGFEPRKHDSMEACARAELSEEAHLSHPVFTSLLPPDHQGLAEVKWCTNRFIPYLVVDPVRDEQPGSRDLEELTIQILRLPLDDFRALMVSGDMLLPSITTSFMALQHLEREGLL